MRAFGKRPNGAATACIFQTKTPPLWCRVIERTPRIICLATPRPELITRRFELVLNGEQLYCEVVSTGADYVAARYSAQPLSSGQLAAELGDTETWRGRN